MNKPTIVSSFSCNKRAFFISTGIFESEGTEFLQLNEHKTVETSASELFATAASSFNKADPIVIATRSKIDLGIEISMLYEGLPLEILSKFINYVEDAW